MSGKPKVYQGVRVKITVKELLQQRRARQAATSAAVSWGSNNIQFSESVSPPYPAPFDSEPTSSIPNYCPSWQFSNCLSCEESPSYLEQLVDSCLQTDAPSDPAFSAFQTSSHCTPDAFQPVPLCFNQSLAPGSPSSPDLSSPLNHSCSPPQLPPFTPVTHSPPSALDTKTYGYPVEEWSCHIPSPYSTSACCCATCGSQHGDNRLPQYFHCPSTDCMDYLPPMAMADDFFRSDRSCDICYS
ncbi:Colca2 [Columba guinea]|nr:Colca2 [Columba guinea]